MSDSSANLFPDIFAIKCYKKFVKNESMCLFFIYILSRENDAKLQVILSSLLDHRLLKIEWIEKCHNPLFWPFHFPDGQSEVPEFW